MTAGSWRQVYAAKTLLLVGAWLAMVLLVCGNPPVQLAAATGLAQAAAVPTVQAVAANGILALDAGESLVLAVNDATRVAVADPRVADIAVISKTEVLVTAKAPGATTLHVWEKAGLITFGVQVEENNSLAERVQAAIDRPGLCLRAVGDKLILEGQLADQNELARALQIAGAFAKDVVNLVTLEHPIQVLLKVEVVEVDRTAGGDIGLTWGGVNRGVLEPNSILYGEIGAWTLQRLSVIGVKIDALAKTGLARLLAAPALTAMSGDTAEFLAGGEIPVVTGDDGQKVTVEWKEYGVKLSAQPVVDAQGGITITLTQEVSTLDWANGIQVSGWLLPALRTRRAQTQVKMSSGDTLILGGMLSSEDSKNVSKLPLLGDLPVLGALFRSEKFTKNETELLFFVTPMILPVGESPSPESVLQSTAEDAL